MATAAILGAAAVGAAGSYASAKASNKPSKAKGTSYITPNSQLGGWAPLQQAQQWMAQTHNPNQQLGDLSYMQQLLNAQKFGSGGGRRGASSGGGGGGRHGGGGGGGGAGGYRGLLNTLQGVQATPSAYEQRVLGDEFLDVANNPYVEGAAGAIRNQLNEDRERAFGDLSVPFAAAGGTMGLAGTSLAARERLADEYGENLADQLAQTYYGLYDRERGRQNEVAGLLSGRTNALYGAGAQGYSADQQKAAQLGAARIRANASMRNAALANSLGSRRLNWDMARGYYSDTLNDALARAGLANDYTSAMHGLGSTFGVQHQESTSQGPQISPWGSAAQGALGAGLATYGAYQAYV